MKQLLPGTVAIIWVMMYLMWILETIMCLSTEVQRGTFRYLIVAEETGSHLVFCSTEGHSLAPVPRKWPHCWGVWEGLEMGICSPWAAAERQSSSAAPPPQRWSASPVLGVPQTHEDPWDLSQLLLGKGDACDFITLYTFSIHLLLHPSSLKASLSGQELYSLWTALGATGFSLTHHWQLPQCHGDKGIAIL